MRIHGLGTLLAFLIGSVYAVAGDWPSWRGPEQNGVSREKNLVDEWALDGPNVLWTSEIGGRATPIVLNGRVYVSCRTNNDVNDPEDLINIQEQVVCWDADTGEVLWRDKFNVFQTDIPAPRVGWASMVGDTESGNVYLHSVSGLFRCYGPDGKVIWEHSLFEEYGKISGYGGRTATPVIDEDRIIVHYMTMNWGSMKAPPPKQRFYAFDKRTGELLWTSAPGGAPKDTTYSVPIVTVIDGIRMLIGGNSDGGVHAIHARTGEPLWSFDMSRRGLNASVVTDGKFVYASHGEDNIDTTAFGRIQCIDATGRGNITDSHSVWRIDGVKAGYASLLVHDGILYVVEDIGNLRAYDSKTGDPLWIFNLGTVGKGSPVWADGKLYVMEVNGNVFTLKPSRETCELVNHVHLLSPAGGDDEIYASPAIANGKIYFVTRDRTICVGKEGVEPVSDPVPALEAEREPGSDIATLRLTPYEVAISAGESVEYELRAYDANGRFLRTVEAPLELTDLGGASVNGMTVTTAAGDAVGGEVLANYADVSATARIRTFPELPWKWTFDGFEGKQVPPTWQPAFLKLQPFELDGDVVMKRPGGGKGRPSTYIWIGTPEMKGYEIRADFRMSENRRRLPDVGLTAHRYNLILAGNLQMLTVQSWAAHRRMSKDISFRSDPDVWYTMRFRVDIENDEAHLKGKVWKRAEQEPAEWTLETTDPHPNLQGSPGLYFYSIADAFIDNVEVTRGENQNSTDR